MARPSISAAGDDTMAFIRAHHALLLPLGLAFFSLPMLAASWVMPAPDPRDPTQSPPLEPWMLWLIPLLLGYLVAFLAGSVAISALALRGGLSVREAVEIALRRLGMGMRVFCIFLAFVIVAAVAISLAGVLVGGSSRAATTNLSVTILIVAILVALARINPIFGLIADREIGAWAAIKGSVALTRGLFWQLLSVTIMLFVSATIVAAAIRFTLGALMLLIGRAAGDAALGDFLIDLLSAIVSGVITTAWTVFSAMLYRRLSASNGI